MRAVGVVFALALSAIVVLGQALVLPEPASSGNFSITALTVSSAVPATMSSARYMATAIMGEPVSLASNGYRLCLGWWCGINTVPYNISISGRLFYADGRPVKNAIVELTVWNVTDFKYSARSRTDTTGNFAITIAELPDALFDAQYFTIEIRAFGDIEAVYRCLYSVSDGFCKKFKR